MRFFKLGKKEFNWKYVLGEILLIFIGINLAIWFNNWNASKKAIADKKVAITKITEEVMNNNNQLDIAQEQNHQILLAYSEYKNKFDGNTSLLLATPAEVIELNSKYPGFYRVSDSTLLENGVYRYNGGTHILLEIPILNEIAWDTTKTLSILNEFDYECLYDLESMYSLQRLVQKEINKAADALQKRELKELMNILGFLNQLNRQLSQNYKTVLENIDNCDS